MSGQALIRSGKCLNIGAVSVMRSVMMSAMCHQPRTSVFYIRWSLKRNQNPPFTFKKTETIIEIKERVVYAFVSNNYHENINQQSNILQVTGC